MRPRTWLFALAVALLWNVASALSALDVPALRGHVNDYAELLSPAARDRLGAQLIGFEVRTGHQLALLTVRSLEGESVEAYSMQVVESWKLGREQVDDGLLVLVAERDRKLRIEVGYGLEGEIPDAIAARVVREIIEPAFKQHQFEYGIEAAFNALISAADHDGRLAVQSPPPRLAVRRAPPRRKNPYETDPAVVGLEILFAMMFLLPVWINLVQLLHRVYTSRDTSFWTVLWEHFKGSSRSSGSHDRSDNSSDESSSSNSSSSDGYSGGGGRFGGGGASGTW